MRALPTVLLYHTTTTGSHYDWLLDQGDDAGGLLTFRIKHPSGQWRAAGKWRCECLAVHRRMYLRYQGVLSGGRGWVRRADWGEYRAVLQTRSRCVFELRMRQVTGCVQLVHMTDQWWQAAWC